MIKFEKTNHILVTYGNDFAFANATLNYLYLDKIIEKWNSHFPLAQMKYSFPIQYIAEIKKIN